MNGGSLERMDGRACGTETVEEERWWRAEVEDDGKWCKFEQRHDSAAGALGQAIKLRDDFPDHTFRVVEVVARMAVLKEEGAGSSIEPSSATGERRLEPKEDK